MNKKVKKVFVVGQAKSYARWIKNSVLVDNIEEADIVMFTGGEDINPALYGCEKHPSTYFNDRRDKEEVEAFKKVRKDQLCLGICRGLQLLAALNGSILIQNVNNHSSFGTHVMINARTEERYEITSIHHQMVYPFKMNKSDYKILYYSARHSDFYEGDGVEYPPCEPEVVLFTKKDMPRCLGIQGHPELMRSNAPTVEMFNQLLDDLLC